MLAATDPVANPAATTEPEPFDTEGSGNDKEDEAMVASEHMLDCITFESLGLGEMAGKTGTASSNVLDLLPFEKWGEKLAESTIAQAKAEQGWVRGGGPARGSKNNTTGGDTVTIRDHVRRMQLEDEEDEHEGLLAAAEIGRPTPGRSSGRQINFDTQSVTAVHVYGHDGVEITKGQIVALMVGIVLLLVVMRLLWMWAWF